MDYHWSCIHYWSYKNGRFYWIKAYELEILIPANPYDSITNKQSQIKRNTGSPIKKLIKTTLHAYQTLNRIPVPS